MGLGVSLILIAVGAILTWAVDAHVSGVNVHAVGVIMMIVGLIGGLFSLAFWSPWWGPATSDGMPLPARRGFAGGRLRHLQRWSRSRPPRSKRSSSKSGRAS